MGRRVGFLTTLSKCLVRSLVVPDPSAFEIAVCSDISQLARGFQEGAVGGEREGASDRDTADARVCQLCDWRYPTPHEYVERTVDRTQDRAHLLDAAQPRRKEDIGAGLLIGLQPRDRVIEVVAAVRVVLRPRREHKMRRAGVRRRSGRGYALGCHVEVVDIVPTPVLHRTSGDPGLPCEAHGLPDPGGIVREAALEVGADGEASSLRHGDRVSDRLLTAHVPVEAAERGGEAATGRGESLEPEPRKQSRRAEIPRVGKQERSLGGMERQKPA